MEELEVTWLRATSVWWAFIWRSVLIGLGVGFLVGVIASIIGLDAQGALFTSLIYLSMVPIGIWLFKYIMTKPFNGFRIALLPVLETEKVVEAADDSEGDSAAKSRQA